MGQFSKVSGDDEEDDENERLVGGGAGGGGGGGGGAGLGGDAKDLGHGARGSGAGWFASREEEEHWSQSRGLCWGCLTPVEALLLLACVLLFSCLVVFLASLAVNAVARRCLALAGTAALGVKTDVGSVTVGVLDARSTVSRLSVANPPGYGGAPPGGRLGGAALPFLDLAEGVFDASFSSFFTNPWLLQEIRLQDLRINIEQKVNADSNAKQIISHLSNLTADRRPSSAGPAPAAGPGGAPPGDERRGVDAVATKFVVGTLSFRNVSAGVCVHPLCEDGRPAYYGIKQIVVHDVGKKSGGIRLHELLEIVVQAVLLAAIRAAPEQIGYDLHRGVADNLRRALDYASVHCDLGSGLQELRDWTSWQLGRLGRLEDAAAAALAPSGTPSAEERARAEAELYGDAQALGKNLSHALGEFGDALQSTLQQVRAGDESPDGRGASLEQGRKSLRQVEQEGLHEAETLASGLLDSLASTAGAAANVSAAAAEVAAEASGGTTALPTLPPAKGMAEAAREAATLAEQELEHASGFEKELRASLLSPSPPPLHA